MMCTEGCQPNLETVEAMMRSVGTGVDDVRIYAKNWTRFLERGMEVGGKDILPCLVECLCLQGYFFPFFLFIKT